MKFKVILIFFLFISSCINSYEEPVNFKEDNPHQSLNIQEQETNQNNNSEYSFLALGDSYTIGEGVLEEERWPNQFVNVAYESGVDIEKPDIIAMTGWKSYELINAIDQTNFIKKYDYVSLLIGVNNQYNSRPIDEFESDLEKLAIKIKNLKTNTGNTIIISIPDWGSSPFGKTFDREKISYEINQFNLSLENFANRNNFKYVDITEISRKALFEKSLIASDSLHPSGKMYLEWAEKIFETWIN
ncbi:MAG: GDSL-type esterase/lipase family protein [Bacteroidota bacterium]